jgi:hypothetical protein
MAAEPMVPTAASAVSGIDLAPGTWLVGELVGLRAGQAYDGRTGRQEPWEVGLTVAGTLLAVQTRDKRTAEGLVNGLTQGDPLALRVQHRFGVRKDGSLWSFFTLHVDGAGEPGGWEL